MRGFLILAGLLLLLVAVSPLVSCGIQSQSPEPLVQCNLESNVRITATSLGYSSSSYPYYSVALDFPSTWTTVERDRVVGAVESCIHRGQPLARLLIFTTSQSAR